MQHYMVSKTKFQTKREREMIKELFACTLACKQKNKQEPTYMPGQN